MPTLLRVALLLAACAAAPVGADVAEFERNVDAALERFHAEVPGARDLAGRAAGILVFPRIFKADFGLGGAGGDGALRVGGRTVQYYRMTGVSFGFQIGAQGRTEILLFTTEEALARFRASANWQAGVDGSITIVRLGAAKSIDTDNLRAPIMGFIFDNAGLMYDLSLKGNKYWKIRKGGRGRTPTGSDPSSSPQGSDQV